MPWTCIIVERLHHKANGPFTISIGSGQDDWIPVRQFKADDLPLGLMVKTLLDENLEGTCIKIGLNEREYAGKIDIDYKKLPVCIRGVTTLFNVNSVSDVLLISLSMRVQRDWNMEKGTQTSTEHRTIATQNMDCLTEDKSVETEARVVEKDQLEISVQEMVERELKRAANIHQNVEERETESIQGQDQPEESHARGVLDVPEDPSQPGFSLLPRMHSLRQLDRLIADKNRQLQSVQSGILREELTRKRRIIMDARKTALQRVTVDAVVQCSEELKGVKKADDTDSYHRTITSTIVSENSSEGSSDDESSSSEQNEGSSDAADSADYSASEPSVNTSNGRKSKDDVDYNISENKDEETAATSLSPTSLYLKELRAKVLKEHFNES